MKTKFVFLAVFILFYIILFLFFGSAMDKTLRVQDRINARGAARVQKILNRSAAQRAVQRALDRESHPPAASAGALSGAPLPSFGGGATGVSPLPRPARPAQHSMLRRP